MAIRRAVPAASPSRCWGRRPGYLGRWTKRLLFELENSVDEVCGFGTGNDVVVHHFRFDSFVCYIDAHFTLDLAIGGDNANVLCVDPGNTTVERYLQSFHGYDRAPVIRYFASTPLML